MFRSATAGFVGSLSSTHAAASSDVKVTSYWPELGVNLPGLACQALRWGLSGLEWCVSVPGTVGGAAVGNAGAHGGALADNLLRATLLNSEGTLVELPAGVSTTVTVAVP